MILPNTQMMLKLDTQFKFIFYSPLLAHEAYNLNVKQLRDSIYDQKPFQIHIKRGDDKNKYYLLR